MAAFSHIIERNEDCGSIFFFSGFAEDSAHFTSGLFEAPTVSSKVFTAALALCAADWS